MSPYMIDPSLARTSLVRSPLVASSDVDPPLGARVARRMVSVCMFCGSARLPARTADGVERWEPLAPSIREEIRAGVPDIVVSHGLCPACARQYYPEFFD